MDERLGEQIQFSDCMSGVKKCEENCPELEFRPAPLVVYEIQLDLAFEDALETSVV